MIKVTLTFTEDDLNNMLEAAWFGEGPAPKVSELSKRQLVALAAELKGTAGNFVDEIVEGTENAAANDWLQDLMADIEAQRETQ